MLIPHRDRKKNVIAQLGRKDMNYQLYSNEKLHL